MQKDYSEVKGQLRSQEWFNNPHNMGMTAVYVERYMNYGWTREELQSGKPVIGIAQTGGDLTPCNRIHVELVDRVKAGIRDNGGIPFEFPVHPIAEQGKRPTAALDRNLALPRAGRNPARLSHRRRRPHHRMRQNHTRLHHGSLHHEPARHRTLWRPHARWALARSSGRIGHGCLGSPRTLRSW